MEAAEDPDFLDAMQAAHIKGALVGVESVTPEDLKDVYKEFNCAGEDLINRPRTFRRHGVYVLGSFIFGLPSDRPETFDATAAAAVQSEIAFAQFVMLTPYPGTVDFNRWEKQRDAAPVQACGISMTRRWLIPQAQALLAPSHNVGRGNSRRTQSVWGKVLPPQVHLEALAVHKSLRARLAFVLISKIYRQMYADTGIATDSPRVARSARWAR
jgi:hypothetical protein